MSSTVQQYYWGKQKKADKKLQSFAQERAQEQNFSNRGNPSEKKQAKML